MVGVEQGHGVLRGACSGGVGGDGWGGGGVQWRLGVLFGGTIVGVGWVGLVGMSCAAVDGHEALR